MNLLRHLCRSKSGVVLLRNKFTNNNASLSSLRFYANKFVSSEKPAAKQVRPAEGNPRDEQLFLISQNDPDRFGGLKTPGTPVKSSSTFDEEDDGDRAEEDYLRDPPSRSQRLNTKQYADIIKDHFRNKRLKEAIDVLEVRMLKEDRVKPENYIYNLLIGECARLGFTKKAFNLFTRMKQRGLKVTGATYTGLFNACSNTPWLQDGLNKANHLRQIMLEKGYEPNASNYNAMIKAFGRGGDIATAFSLVDEMQMKRLPVDVQTYNFVLQACVSDPDLGFRHALLVWHKMLRRRIIPDIYSFNLMLRCVRDCGIGDLPTTKDVIEQILLASRKGLDEVPTLETKLQEDLLLISPSLPKEHSNPNDVNLYAKYGVHSFNDQLTTTTNASKLQNPSHSEESLSETPNLLSSLPHLGRLMALSEVRKPEDRLLLIGGASGFLHEMALAKVEPDIKTFTQLIEVLPPTYAAEKKLLAKLKRMSIKCDIDFFNVLIKKRCMRFEYEGAKVSNFVVGSKLSFDVLHFVAGSAGSDQNRRPSTGYRYLWSIGAGMPNTRRGRRAYSGDVPQGSEVNQDIHSIRCRMLK